MSDRQVNLPQCHVLIRNEGDKRPKVVTCEGDHLGLDLQFFDQERIEVPKLPAPVQCT